VNFIKSSDISKLLAIFVQEMKLGYSTILTVHKPHHPGNGAEVGAIC
jgi:hypothetical protein